MKAYELKSLLHTLRCKWRKGADLRVGLEILRRQRALPEPQADTSRKAFRAELKAELETMGVDHPDNAHTDTLVVMLDGHRNAPPKESDDNG